MYSMVFGCNMVELICICQNISKWESYSYYLSPKLLLSYSNMLFWLRVKSNFLHTLNPLVRMHYREWLRYSSILKARKRSGLWKVKCYILVLLWMPLISNFDDKRSKKTSKKWKLWHKKLRSYFFELFKRKKRHQDYLKNSFTIFEMSEEFKKMNRIPIIF